MRNFIDILNEVYDGASETECYPLYHGTSLLCLLLILHSNYMRADNSSDYAAPDLLDVPGVSLTRNIDVAWSFARDSSQMNNANLTQFMKETVIDDLPNLKNVGGAIIKFKCSQLHRDYQIIRDNMSEEQTKEEEERVVGPINNVKNYIIAVRFNDNDLWFIEQALYIIVNNHDDLKLRNEMRNALAAALDLVKLGMF